MGVAIKGHKITPFKPYGKGFAAISVKLLTINYQ